MDLQELITRERVRDTYAAYTHAGDRFRLEELAACFAEHGVLEIKGGRSASGRAAIIGMLGGGRGGQRPAGEPPLVRHFIANLSFTTITPERVEATAYFCVLTRAGAHLGPDHWGRYRDVLVPEADRWVFRHRLVAVDAVVPTGWYASR